jgi:hypothetical protein
MKQGFAKSIVRSAVFMSFCWASVAQADVADRIVQMQGSPAEQYAQIVDAASAMCREAADQGEVFDVRRCVRVVVARTIAEIDRPQLAQFAQTAEAKAAL